MCFASEHPPGLKPLLAGLICLSVLSPAYSAENALLDSLNRDIDPETITISGKRTLSNVERQLERAHSKQYRLFNNLVEEREFRIICRKIAKTGTFLRERQCRPRFIKRSRLASQPDANSVTFTDLRGARSDTYRPVDLLEGMSTLAINREEQRKFDRLHALMIELGSENPTLGEAIIRVHQLNLLYRDLLKQAYTESKGSE